MLWSSEDVTPSGIYPVLYAFWDKQDRLDRAAMQKQVEHCIAAGAHGIAVLGLVTEVNKMDVNERMALVEMVGEMIAGRVRYAVTVAEPSLRGQIEFARFAGRNGADWVILQPPTARGATEAELIRFFGTVAGSIDIPVAVQNNPVNLDVSLSVGGLVELNRQHPNITILKGEGWSVDIARVIEMSQGAYVVFGGHGGIEFPSMLRAGSRGLIPAPECLVPQVRMFELWESGTPEARAEVDAIHRLLLPTILFMSRSLPGMLCYGKRLFAAQAGITVEADRSPAIQPTEYGMAELRHLKAMLDEAARMARQPEPDPV